MVSQRNAQKPGLTKRRRKRPHEEVWVKAFVEHTGTEKVTKFNARDLHGVSLTRIVEALRMGSMTWATKCNGAGTICEFVHAGDDDMVEVAVWFEANEEKLEIREARRIEMEDDSEPNAA